MIFLYLAQKLAEVFVALQALHNRAEAAMQYGHASASHSLRTRNHES